VEDLAPVALSRAGRAAGELGLDLLDGERVVQRIRRGGLGLAGAILAGAGVPWSILVGVAAGPVGTGDAAAATVAAGAAGTGVAGRAPRAEEPPDQPPAREEAASGVRSGATGGAP
jgi:hypothetical protein